MIWGPFEDDEEIDIWLFISGSPRHRAEQHHPLHIKLSWDSLSRLLKRSRAVPKVPCPIARIRACFRTSSSTEMVKFAILSALHLRRDQCITDSKRLARTSSRRFFMACARLILYHPSAHQTSRAARESPPLTCREKPDMLGPNMRIVGLEPSHPSVGLSCSRMTSRQNLYTGYDGVERSLRDDNRVATDEGDTHGRPTDQSRPRRLVW
jgi:hypothetical protein